MTRLFFVRNDSGSTSRFFDQVLDDGQEWEIEERKLGLWRDEPTVSGFISSGNLAVGNGSTWFDPPRGLLYFFDDPTPTTINWPENSLIAVASGTNIFGGVEYDFIPKAIATQGLTVTSGIEGLSLEVDSVIGLGSVTITSGTNTVTVSGAPTYGLQQGPDGILYTQDPTRGKTLSVTRPLATWGAPGQQKLAFLKIAGVGNSQAGLTLPRPATVTAFTSNHEAGDMILRITASGSTGTFFLETSPLPAGLNVGTSIDIDLPGESTVQFYLANTSNVRDPVATIELAWRLE